MSHADVSSSSRPSSGGRALYVYYRVRRGQEAAARTAIETMQATLRPLQPGLRARLMCRVEAVGAEGAAEQTWMEVYEHAEGVSHACEAMLEALASALPDDLMGTRHVEIFAPVTSIAPVSPATGAT